MSLSKIIIFLARAYQRYISVVTPPSCRFFPTCSQYAIEAVEKHGSVKGISRTASRLLRCHPFHPGGYDPVR